MCKVRATIGMLINQTFEFESYLEASNFGDSLIENAPIGEVAVYNAKGERAWGYTKKRS